MEEGFLKIQKGEGNMRMWNKGEVKRFLPYMKKRWVKIKRKQKRKQDMKHLAKSTIVWLVEFNKYGEWITVTKSWMLFFGQFAIVWRRRVSGRD